MKAFIRFDLELDETTHMWAVLRQGKQALEANGIKVIGMKYEKRDSKGECIGGGSEGITGKGD